MGPELKRKLHNWLSAALPWSAPAIFILLLIGIVRHGTVGWDDLKTNKDNLAALQSILTMIVMVFASFVSYFRFFRGRLLATRAEVTIACNVTSLGDVMLHSVTVNAKNVGTLTIWDPIPSVRLEHEEALGSARQDEITDWIEDTPLHENERNSINAGETGSYFIRYRVSKGIAAVTYLARVSSSSGASWATSATVANTPAR